MTPQTKRSAVERRPFGAYDPRAVVSPVVPFPIVLQRRARESTRDHLRRALVRVTVLASVDAGVVLLARELLHLVRDRAGFGAMAAQGTMTLIPRGSFPTVQLLAAMALGLAATGNYGPGDRRRDLPRALAGSTLGLVLLFWTRVWREPVAALLALGVSILFGGIAIGLGRLVVERIVRRLRPVSAYATRALVLGSADAARRALECAALRDGAEFRPIGFLDANDPPAPDALGGFDALVPTVDAHEVDTIVLAGHIGDKDFMRVVSTADAAGCHVLSLSHIFSPSRLEPHLVVRRGIPFIELTRPALRGRQLLVKRALDVTGAGLGLLLASPVMLACALLVKLTSPGPMIFRQIRVGVGGRRFQIFKFRSMVRDAEARRRELERESVYGDGRLFKVVGDPRVTRVGAFLRRTSLDELPQLWNVLRGDMSLVGPRPPLPTEVALYEEHHYSRFDMRPGITGPWQVSGRNAITDFDDVIMLETAYMRGWTIWKDLAILLRTVPVVLRMRGAH